MPDIIKLLPDSVANQIAAGEVIQRPASAVKELLENAIDAGATQIKLIIKDAGKTLIQIVDNGRGMSQTDARLCFERHATSKISQASDLFSIRTMGFRGEALASVAAISRVELKTRTAEDTIGTQVVVEGSVTEKQEPCQCSTGTSISVKNLFYNTPARRHFLKSDQVEKSHIYNEFIRAALAQPDIEFQYFQGSQMLARLTKGNLKQRIVSLFGNNYLNRLVPVEEKTDILLVSGFVVKPEFAKKRRGEQYFYVNNRYIRSPYLNHAVEQAFKELIPEDMFPSFFIFIETDPEYIDVNVHPTKTEVKFQDERYTYQIIKTAVKRSLGRYNLTPTLDFERETAFDDLVIDTSKPPSPPSIRVNPDFNPFDEKSRASSMGGSLTSRINPEQWEKLFPDKDESVVHKQPIKQSGIDSRFDVDDREVVARKFIHLQNRFLLIPVKSGVMIIDQQRAHERILYERYISFLDKGDSPKQQLLFPESIILMDNETLLLRDMLNDIKGLGFEISEAGKNTFIITAVPADMLEQEPLQDVFEGFIEQFQKLDSNTRLDTKGKLARSLAKRLSIKHGRSLGEQEMIALTESLFLCKMPYQSPAGKPVLIMLHTDEIADRFK